MMHYKNNVYNILLCLLEFTLMGVQQTSTAILCNEGEILCDGSDSCILKTDLCNGFVDCPNGWDETENVCHDRPCSSSLGLDGLFGGPGSNSSGFFRCSYGGCIKDVFSCNGNIDCADGSDETEEECSKITCPGGHFRCNYGACIRRSKLCNGIMDCRDASDETKNLCGQRNKICYNQAKCDYGACYERKLKCDGKKDCSDGSDEKESECEITTNTTTTLTTTTRATTPTPVTPTKTAPAAIESSTKPSPPGTVFGPPINIIKDCRPPNCRCPQKSLSNYCLPCQELDDRMNATCQKLGNPDVCSIDAVEDASVEVISCGAAANMLLTGAEHDGNNCLRIGSTLVPVMTVVYVECWGTALQLKRCHSDGLWRPYRLEGIADYFSEESGYGQDLAMEKLCQPSYMNSNVCGRQHRFQRNGSQLLELGKFYDGKYNRRPYVVGLKKNERYKCSGTLITSRHVITAAHCLARTKESAKETMDITELMVQISDDKRHDRTVSRIFLHPSYTPGRRPRNDIALILLERPLVLSRTMYPACIDLNGSSFYNDNFYALAFSRKNNLGHKYKELLQKVDPVCFNHLDKCYEKAIDIPNQFCGVDKKGTDILSKGSSGGPYLQDLQFGNEEGHQWAVAGIVSSYVKQKSCPPHIIYTFVKEFREWIIEVVHQDNLDLS